MKKLILISFTLLCNQIVFSQIPSYVPIDGLVGWWPFNSNANDESGNENHGVVFGATITNDRNNYEGMAYNFDGENDYIEIPNSPTLNSSSITISGWFKIETEVGIGNNGAQSIMSKWYQFLDCDSNSDTYTTVIYNSGNGNTVVGATSQYVGPLLSSNNIDLFQWYHVVFVHDSMNGGKLFINGNLVSHNEENGEICSSLNPVLFGSDNYFGEKWRFFDGDLDDFAMWNRVLTDKEIDDLYRSVDTNTTTDVNNTSSPVEFGGKVECYPNPTTDVINVDLSGLNDYSGQKLRIMNLSGQIVYEENVNQSKVVIDVKSVMTSGIYVLNTVDQNGNVTSTNKFVVQ